MSANYLVMSCRINDEGEFVESQIHMRFYDRSHADRYAREYADMNPGRRLHVETIGVSGKAEARRIAAARGAKCWNF